MSSKKTIQFDKSYLEEGRVSLIELIYRNMVQDGPVEIINVSLVEGRVVIEYKEKE